jgi:hypothetical protein
VPDLRPDDDLDGPPPLHDWEAVHVRAIRARMEELGWVSELAPDDWYPGMGDEDGSEGRCLAFVDLFMPGGGVFTIGAFFNGRTTTLGDLESQSMVLDRDSVVLPPRVLEGPLQDQAVQTADWLHWMYGRPILRRSWGEHAHEWAFADDGTVLARTIGRSRSTGPPVSQTSFTRAEISREVRGG